MEEKKENYVAEWVAPPVAAAGAIGVGMIDQRKPLPKFEEVKHLGDTYDQVKQYIRPGDYLIGASRMPSEVMVDEINDFKKTFKKSKAKGRGFFGSLSDSVKQFDIASLLSKSADPHYSHIETVVSPKSSIYIGGAGKSDIRSNFVKTKGMSPHYLIVRPKSEAQSRLLSAYRQGGSKAVDKVIKPYLGGAESYKGMDSVYSQIKDWFRPKFKTPSRDKTVAELASDAACTTGSCATVPAALSNKTIAGKKTRFILPTDILRSDDFEIVGRVGTARSKFSDKFVSNATKYLARGILGTAAAGAAFGGVKAIKAISKRRREKAERAGMVKRSSILRDAYDNALRQELKKIIVGK